MAHITQLATSSLSNQNISAALLAHTYTNTSRIREIQINVFVDQVAGGGDYIAFITLQRAGAGSFYETARMAKTALTGTTSVMFQSQWFTINATDVVKVYVLGLAGDTTTPDIVTDINEKWLNVDANGAVVAASVANAIIKKNTALANFEFLMIDSADHFSPKTGLTVTATRSIDGGAFGACANSVSEVANGVYKISLAAADLNGDVITLKFTATGADQTTITILTQA